MYRIPAVRRSRVIYQNKWMLLKEDEIIRADGSDGIYAYVDKPDFALVIPVEDSGVHLVEQFRYPIGRRSLEFPQGTYPDRRDADPIELARKELKEETGLFAGRLDYLGRLFGGPGMSNQGFHVFVATDLVAGETDREIEETDMTQSWLSFTDFEDLLAGGEIVDAPTIAAYTLYRFRLPR